MQRPAAAPVGASYLSVLTVDAFAAAVRGQGLGLLPAAVNAAYRLLARRIHALSQVRMHMAILALEGFIHSAAQWTLIM